MQEQSSNVGREMEMLNNIITVSVNILVYQIKDKDSQSWQKTTQKPDHTTCWL
jgi:hypothetical protein